MTRQIIAWLRNLSTVAFGCIHANYTWPRHDAHGCYVRCLDCGARIESIVKLEGRCVV